MINSETVHICDLRDAIRRSRAEYGANATQRYLQIRQFGQFETEIKFLSLYNLMQFC